MHKFIVCTVLFCNTVLSDGRYYYPANLGGIVAHRGGINCRTYPDGKIKTTIPYRTMFHMDKRGVSGKYKGWNHNSQRKCWVKMTSSIRLIPVGLD